MPGFFSKRFDVNDSLGNFLEKTQAAQSSIISGLYGKYEKLEGSTLAFFLTDIIAGAFAAVPVYGPALCAGSLIIFKILIDNPDPIEQQRKLIGSIVKKEITDFYKGQMKARLEGMNNLLIARQTDEKKMRDLLRNPNAKPEEIDIVRDALFQSANTIHSQFIIDGPSFLVASYEEVGLPLYAIHSSMHLIFLYDIMLRKTDLRLTPTHEEMIKDKFKFAKKNIIDTLKKTYAVCYQRFYDAYPDKQFEKVSYYKEGFDKRMEFRNQMIRQVFDPINFFLNLDIDLVVNKPIEFYNPRPLFSKICCKTFDVAYTSYIENDFPVIKPNGFRMKYLRPTEAEIKSYITNGHFNYGQIIAVIFRHDGKRVHTIKHEYFAERAKEEYESSLVGLDYNNLLSSAAPQIGSSVSVNTIDDIDGQFYFISYVDTSGNNQFYKGVNPYYPSAAAPTELLSMKDHSIGQIVGIPHDVRLVDVNIVGLFGIIVAFVPNETIGFPVLGDSILYLSPTKLMREANNCSLAEDYNNIGDSALKFGDFLNSSAQFYVQCSKAKQKLYALYFEVEVISEICTIEVSDAVVSKKAIVLKKGYYPQVFYYHIQTYDAKPYILNIYNLNGVFYLKRLIFEPFGN